MIPIKIYKAVKAANISGVPLGIHSARRFSRDNPTMAEDGIDGNAREQDNGSTRAYKVLDGLSSSLAIWVLRDHAGVAPARPSTGSCYTPRTK